MTTLARALLKKFDMLNPATLLKTGATPAVQNFENFWTRILGDEMLSDCDDLQKLVVGCELIAALDEADLLAA
jgi:hypothetical protein